MPFSALPAVSVGRRGIGGFTSCAKWLQAADPLIKSEHLRKVWFKVLSNIAHCPHHH